MSLVVVAFYAFAAVTLVGAIGAVTLRNVAHSLLSLVVVFFGVASLFFTLRADFIGVIQILVYVGAVAVLIVFAIVLTRSHETSPPAKRGNFRWAGAVIAAVTAGVMVTAIMRAPEATVHDSALPVGSADEVGNALMTTYAVPFELASILLTAALIGAVVIAMDEVARRVRAKS